MTQQAVQAVLNATCAMQVGRHHFRAESVECLKRQASTGLLSRSALAEGLCESERWMNHWGELCLGSARKTLPVLCDRLDLALPASRRALGGSAGHRKSRPVEDPVPDQALRCSLVDLGALSLRLVSSVEDRRRWVAMMEARHPQGWSRPPGVEVCYWIEFARQGALGGMNFCAASWRQRARDRFLGWSPDVREANLDRVVNNQRLLILTRVRVWGLASSVLREAVRRLPEDWRCAPETRALAVQDMSSLNHGSHGATEGLASIGRNGKATANGLRIHVGLAVTEAGRSLGLFEPNADDRGKLDNESRRWLQGMDRAREVAEACPNTRVITVCDQEGDFRDLLLKAESERQGLLVRARRRQARWIVVRNQLQHLRQWMASRPPRERRTLSLPVGEARRRAGTASERWKCLPSGSRWELGNATRSSTKGSACSRCPPPNRTPRPASRRCSGCCCAPMGEPHCTMP